MKTGTTLGAQPETLAHLARKPDRQWPCSIPGCLGWHTSRCVVDGVEVLTVFCDRHTELRQRAVWALDPCDRWDALTGGGCMCEPGEPSCTPCLAIRAYYLPLALEGCVARSCELERLRALPPSVEGVEPVAGGGGSRRLRAAAGLIVHHAREHAPVLPPVRRTGLSTA